ncbi:hypothetical protein A5642_08310 [Mycolicibacterium mucogenicum]|uniref:PE-PGRS family protein n=2 Tax=Mycolicibacterium mucogenicum TaxID=56689 RepID=A0A1A0LPV2_MYCMU|nr:hypothetical protein A5642_08310 [Mycolicibacterium mucogenicum]
MGAGVIALAPVTHQPAPDLHLPALHASAVQLAAQVNPITQWGQIITEALQNTKGIVTGVIADPAPVLGQVVRNQIASAVAVGGSVRDYLVAVGQQLGTTPESLKQAFQQLAAGHVADAVQTLYSAVLTPFVLPILTTSILTDVQAAFRKPVQNMLNVIDTAITSPTGMGWVLTAGLPLLAVMSDVVTATGDGLQNVVNAFSAKNLGAVVNAIVAMPGSITGALLNGYNGDGAGILGPNGIVQGLRNALGIIATAIKPVTPPPAAAVSVPSPAPTMVALSTATPTAKPAVETKSLAAVSTVSAEKAASDKTAAGKTAPVAESGATTTAAAGADVDSAPAKTPASDNAGSSASAADGDGAAAPSAPATKPDHPTPGAKPSSGDAGGAEASTAGGAKGADASTTSTRKGATKPKRGAGKAKGADSSASDSGSGSGRSHDSAGKGAGKGTHRAAKAGGE